MPTSVRKAALVLDLFSAERTLDPTAHIPDNVDAVAARYAAAAPGYGMEFLIN